MVFGIMLQPAGVCAKSASWVQCKNDLHNLKKSELKKSSPVYVVMQRYLGTPNCRFHLSGKESQRWKICSGESAVTIFFYNIVFYWEIPSSAFGIDSRAATVVVDI
jgi:hypothetical protein